jgi:hypothetical protein
MSATPLTDLLEDERWFDVEVVRSAVEFLNERFTTNSWEERCRHFRWLKPAQIKLARKKAIQTDELEPFSAERPVIAKLNGSIESEQESLSRLGSLFLVGLSDIQGRETDMERIVRGRVSKKSADYLYQLAHDRASADKWLDRVLSNVDFVTHFERAGRRRTRITLPWLKSPEQALVYALDVLDENRWDLRHRVRKCPYVEQSSRDFGHWFLDYRLDSDDSRLTAGRSQRFCGPAHANAFRQREFRRRASRQLKKHK